MMSEEARATLAEALMRLKGDNLRRAKLAFEGLDLDGIYGNSGLTRRQILSQYQEHEDRCDRAAEELRRG